jgi:PAS domain S-box-containing protein
MSDRFRAEEFAAGTLVVRGGMIVYASDGVARLTGRDAAELVGRPFEDFVAPDDRERVVARHARRMRGEPEPREYEFALLRSDGTLVAVECHVDRDGTDALVHLRDLSGQAVRRLRLEALAGLGAAIQQERTEEAVSARVRDGLSELGLSSALFVAEAEAIRVGWVNAPPAVTDGFASVVGAPLAGYRAAWTPFSRQVWEEGHAFADDWGAAAAAMIPREHRDAIHAVVNASGISRAVAVRLDERAAVRAYLLVAGDWLRPVDVPALRLFGAQVTAALDAARAIGDLSRRNADLAALNRIGELVGEATDLPMFFRRANDVLRGAAGCLGVAIFVVDEAEGVLARVFDDGAPEDVRARSERVPLDTPLGAVARDRLARVLSVEEADPADRPLLASRGLGTAAWVPLVARSKVVGVMTAGYSAPLEFVRGRLDLLTSVAAHFASAIESHGLLSDLRNRVSELTLLNDVALASAQLDPVLLLENALRRVCETFHAEAAAAFLREGDGLALVASLGLSPETLRRYARIGLGDGLPGLALQRLAPVRADDVSVMDPVSVEVSRAERLQSAVSVPLLAKGQNALGAIVFGRRTRRAVEEGELTLLSAVGAQLGVAVENARLFADVRRRLTDLEAVHALALRIFGNAAGDVQAILDDGCREAARALGCRAAMVLLVDAPRQVLRGAAAFGAPFEPGRIEIPVDRDELSADAIRRRAPAWSEDVTRDPRSVMFGKKGVPPQAMLVVPLTSRAATRGVLFLADDAGRAFSDAELALAQALAGELAVGLENAELYAEARRRVEELSLLNEMGATVAGSLDLERVLTAGAEAARRLLDGSRGFVVLYDPVRSELRVEAGAGLDHAALVGSRRLVEPGGVSMRVIRERRPVVVEDVQAEPEVNPEYRDTLGAKSLAAAPLLLRGEPLGVLVVDETRRRRAFTEVEVERLGAVANQLAVAIENARLYAEARGRLAELSTVIEVARVVSSSLDLEEVLRLGAEHLTRTLQGTGCTILLEDHRNRELRRAVSTGRAAAAPVVTEAESTLAADARAARAPVSRRPGEGGARGASALLAVPLHVRDQPVGVALVAAEPDRVFGPGELSRAMAIASQLAVAVDNARLYSEARRRAEELGLVNEVGRSLVATLDIERVLDAGARNLARIVDASTAAISLLTEDGTALQVRALSANSPALLGYRIPLQPADASVAALVFSRREPIVIEDATTDPRVRPDTARFSAGRAYIGLPLQVRDRAIGAVVIVDERRPRRFSAAEVERAAAITNQLAVAVENARLYEDLRRSYAELAQAQRQLIQQERLAALGELSAVVAHEVRNPLGVIFNSLGSLRRLLRPHGDAKMLLDIVGEEADRLNRIVGDLLDFARPSTPELRSEPLERVVDEAVAAALAQNAPGIEVRRDPDPELPSVAMDARLVRQAILNVAVNAVQAMPRGGRLTIRTRREDRVALLEIEDTGGGIPEEVRGRIFEPFFTTKASGTGLGLAVVKRIIEGHGGEISVLSRPGAGTTFSLRFPFAPPGEPEPGGTEAGHG